MAALSGTQLKITLLTFGVDAELNVVLGPEVISVGIHCKSGAVDMIDTTGDSTGWSYVAGDKEELGGRNWRNKTIFFKETASAAAVIQIREISGAGS